MRIGHENHVGAREAKNCFGLVINTTRTESALIEMNGRGLVVSVFVKKFERLSVQPRRADKMKTGTNGASKGGE